jgi:hypothetical protein
VLNKLFFIFLSFLMPACASSIDADVKDGVHILLLENSNGLISVHVFNNSKEEYLINGIFGLGHVQSAVTYEIDGKAAGGVMSGGAAQVGFGMPVLVNPQDYRILLPIGATYGINFSKSDFWDVNGLERGKCHSIRAIYTPPDNSYSGKSLESNALRVCF